MTNYLKPLHQLQGHPGVTQTVPLAQPTAQPYPAQNVMESNSECTALVPMPKPIPAPPETPRSEGNQFFLANDTGNADRLVARFSPELTYCVERAAYYAWDGRRWFRDDFRAVERRAEDTILSCYAWAASITDRKEREAYVRFLSHSLQKPQLSNMMHLAKKKVREVSINDFDSDPWLLNCENGIVDLECGDLHPHMREAMCSLMIPIAFDPNAECPLFLSFLDRAMGGHPDATDTEREGTARRVDYLHRLFGCAATGKPEKVLPILHGKGNNGKTTLLEIISEALGPYAGTMQINSLLAGSPYGMSNAALADVADLIGKRFVVASEPDEGRHLALALVKLLTGTGKLKARHLYENWITFPPTHKLFLDCNTRPGVSNPNDAFWNRARCIAFDVTIPHNEIDTRLGDKMRRELPGILRWIVQGAGRYAAEGLEFPREVERATDDYRTESNDFIEFTEDECVRGKDATVPAGELRLAYEQWAEKNRVDKLPSKQFHDRVLQLGCTKAVRRDTNGKQNRVWIGISLRASESG
jgi:putative DNA primase/helicase